MIGNYTALDLETTGLNPKYDKIIEVGAVKVRNGEIIDSFQQLVCPGIALPEKITGLTGITQEELLEAKGSETVIPQLLDFGSIDVSFISLTLVLPVLHRLLKETGEALCLVKPQFEAGKGKVGKKGVVREPEIHCEVLEKILNFCNQNGFLVLDMDYSPIKGPEGNIEYLFYMKKSNQISSLNDQDVQNLVAESHQCLDSK